MPTHDDNAWTELAAEACDAGDVNGSGWGRYGLPMDAIDFPSEAEASQPSPELSVDEIPAAVLKTITSLDEAIRSAGTLRKPCTAWIGLELPPEAGGFPFPLEVGRYICLTGFVSATLLPGPAVYAAGPRGAFTAPAGRIVRGDLVLEGTCLRCGGSVARVVEGA